MGAITVSLAALPACAQPAPDDLQPVPVVRAGTNDPLANAVYAWKRLTQTPAPDFSSYANFLLNHPGWPGEADLRKRAESLIRIDTESQSQVAAYFRVFAPQTAAGHMRNADALMALGDASAANLAARQAWLTGALTPDDETRLFTRYPAAIRPGDDDARMDKLLWARATTPALRQLQRTSPERRAAFSARHAFLTKSIHAASYADLVPAEQRQDSGYVIDRIFWLRATGQSESARATLATLRPLNTAPADPAKWLAMLEGVMEDADRSGQYQSVLDIGRQIEKTYPAGVSPRDRNAAERNAYTDVTWLAGTVALNKFGRARDAITFFELYSKAARSPQTQVKGLYWAARAAERAGQRDLAQSYFTQAAEFFDQFHGQLALERLGRKPAIPQDYATIEVSGSERSAFERKEIVRAAMLLGQTGQWQDQTRFIRTLSNTVQSPAEHVLAAELSKRLNRPDLSVLIGRSAREKGFGGYARFSFPMMRVPDEHQSSWTIIHAITRQESQFDREAQSRVGARGLMQLMPGTAKMTAPAAGVTYDLLALTKDPEHNIRLGSTYFGQLMTRYNGSYMLSVAAYNAGPGNVNKWLAANGDPRQPGVDPLTWIEAIPFSETRGYVQRVLENFVVYDQLNPRKPAGSGVQLATLLGQSGSAYGSR